MSSSARNRGWLEMAARNGPLAWLGRSKWPLEHARRRRGARKGRSSPLGSAGLKMAARAGSVRLALASKTLQLPTFATSSSTRVYVFMSLCFLRHITYHAHIRHTTYANDDPSDIGRIGIILIPGLCIMHHSHHKHDRRILDQLKEVHVVALKRK
jgi:hypothetical protein